MVDAKKSIGAITKLNLGKTYFKCRILTLQIMILGAKFNRRKSSNQGIVFKNLRFLYVTAISRCSK